MGSATKNAKVVAISLGSLQRLIALRAVPQSAVPLIISTMNDAMSQGVDIQLRILQTLVSLITNFPSVHGQMLGEALLLCFRLQESRIAVVSSTAAATLRQLVMFVVDKMVEEDRRDAVDPKLMTEVTLPDGCTAKLGPYARDAYSVFEDLCLLANMEKPHFLNLEYLHKTFALELIESVLTNYHDLFRKHEELLMLLQHHLCPMLLKSLSDRAVFPLTLRCTRVVFLLLKQFSFELKTEAEVFLMLLIRMISDDAESAATDHTGSRPAWTRVLAMEIMRGLCSDAELIRNMWDRYDAQQSGSKVFTSLISALKRLVTEKPALLGVSSQMLGVGAPSNTAEGTSALSYGLDVGGVAGMVANAAATAASATVSGVVGMIGSGAGLSVQNSAMKLQCIDQLDKADSPPIPESYVYLLGVQCIVSLCEGFASFTGPLYTSLMPIIRAPPALDLSTLPPDEQTTRHLRLVRSMVDNGWPALLAALSFIISTSLSDELFVDVLTSYQAMASVAGMLALTTPRDAFLTSLAKFAIPSRSYIEPSTPRSGVSLTENLGLTTPAQPPGLSERNLVCLKVLGSLGESWYGILEALQNADYVLTMKGLSQPSSGRRPSGFGGSNPPSRSVSGVPVSPKVGGGHNRRKPARHPLLADIDPDNLSRILFNALCKLSSEMVGMQSDIDEPSSSTVATSSPRNELLHRRRVSGIHLQRTLRSGDFGVERLGTVAMLNIHRLIYRAPEVAWNMTISHLLSVVCPHSAPQAIRVQAARILDEMLVIVPRNLSSTGDLQAKVQRRVLDVLAKQIVPTSDAGTAGTSTNVELRRMGLETIHQILQASGHILVVGWGSIFEMLGGVCKPAIVSRTGSMDSVSTFSLQEHRPKPLPLGYNNERGYTAIVKIVFQSLKLVCDSVPRLCISTLGQFGRQADTNIVLTAAERLLWSVSDSIQAKRKDADEGPEYSALWMLGLCTDARPEVRVGAIQTLFRAMQLYGATLSLDTWNDCMWKTTFPLLDAISVETRRSVPEPSVPPAVLPSGTNPDQAWDESKSLALQSIGSIIKEFLVAKIMRLPAFPDAWKVFVAHIQDTVLLDRRPLSTPALQCLEKAVNSLSAADDGHTQPQVAQAWECVWQACDDIGSVILQGGKSHFSQWDEASRLHRAFTQDSLVAFIDVIRTTRNISRQQVNAEWPLERALTYPNSPDYRPDVDALTPVQASVIDAIQDVDLAGSGVPSLVMRDLSEYCTLPFLAGFHTHAVQASAPGSPTTPVPGSTRKQITYVALSKKTMPSLVELYLRFKDRAEIYEDGTLEAVYSAYTIAIKLKYDCPAPSKFGKDLPLWKTATTCFLSIVTACVTAMSGLGEAVSDNRIEAIWRQIIEGFRGGILADCSATENLSLEEREVEENFDLALISSLEIDLVPHLGNPRVPDYLVAQLAKILHQGSLGNGTSSTGSSRNSREEFEKLDLESLGSTATGDVVPRERFSFWCFDLLFLICSNVTSDQETSRKRVAALCLPSLLDRCKTAMVGYIADEALRGSLPFPRVREDELLYVLRKLLDLRLWPGTLWAALSDSPSRYCSSQPAVDPSLAPSALIADVVKRSSVAHIFYFYQILCEIGSISRKTPSAWVLSSGDEPPRPRPRIGAPDTDARVIEVDARALTKECLRVLGKEMGTA
ncbi:guanine nucleotide exchange factor in Golgi transport N-terminal-domain-containing protein [Melanogaster broomeanus]|nr:guanine nucleotide exchange factor in Golgi transport N-terminal-domain-containing protein [Melanogaster broomeanus]